MRPSSLSRRAACSVMRACAARILGRQRRGPQRGARRGARRARLQRVQAVAVGGRPAAPDVRRLAQRAVARAGHVAEHAVDAHGLALRRALPGASARRAYRCAGPARRRGAAGPARRRGARLCVADGGEDGGVVVGHDERGAGHALGVVREQVAALRVGVVGDDKACVGGARACPAARRGGAQRARRGGGAAPHRRAARHSGAASPGSAPSWSRARRTCPAPARPERAVGRRHARLGRGSGAGGGRTRCSGRTSSSSAGTMDTAWQRRARVSPCRP